MCTCVCVWQVTGAAVLRLPTCSVERMMAPGTCFMITTVSIAGNKSLRSLKDRIDPAFPFQPVLLLVLLPSVLNPPGNNRNSHVTANAP